MAVFIGTVLLLSITGSLHCAGMCGAFVAFAAGTGGGRVRASHLHAAYNLGRLITYTVMGLVAGAIGHGIDLGGAAFGMQDAAAVLAGATMVLFGLVILARIAGVRAPRLRPPRLLVALATRGHRFAMTQPPVLRAWLIGLLTTLLPCGFLYFFVLLAAGTGGPLAGALTMAVFWVGTLPVMLTIGIGVAGLTGSFRRYVPTAAAFVFVVLGVVLIVHRSATPAMADVMGDAPMSLDEAVDRRLADEAEPACCDDGP